MRRLALAFLLLTSGMTANAALADMVDHSAAQGISSPLSLLAGMVPDNIIDPFLKNNSLQLLILALLGGVALGKAGQYSVTLTNLASGLEKFFNTCVDIVVGFTPFAVFAVTLMMVLSFSFYALAVTLNILGIVLLGLLAVFLFYLIGLMVFGHISPLPFLRKYLPHMVETFWCGSGITAIPITRRCCEKELGIHPSITAISIPLGALSNLDGNCVYLTVAGLFLAKLCGVDMLGGDVVTVMLMVLILSVGSPITPGSAILAMTLLMGQMGIDLRVISLVLGVNSLVEMFLAACNCAGDVVTSLVVAKRAGKLDTEVYKK